jgi:hypothetical protein
MARKAAAAFVDEFHEPLDPAQTDRDAVAWETDAHELGLPGDTSEDDPWWPVYQAKLVAETKRLCAGQPDHECPKCGRDTFGRPSSTPVTALGSYGGRHYRWVHRWGAYLPVLTARRCRSCGSRQSVCGTELIGAKSAIPEQLG